MAQLERKIGQQTLEIDFLKRALQHVEEQRLLRRGGDPAADGDVELHSEIQKIAPAGKIHTRIAILESDPLRLMGFRLLFASEPSIELVVSTLGGIGSQKEIEVILLGSQNNQNIFETIAGLKAARPDLCILVTQPGADDEMILKVLIAGAKGYVDEASGTGDFVKAIDIMQQGSIWAPRRVLALFIERVTSFGKIFPGGLRPFSPREKETLELLAAGRSNREIGDAMGIGERTVKAHVAQLLRKVGVRNRVALSVHAITNSLLRGK